ncbi:MAG: TonB-dependent receptor [Bacteroidetes bacterium]|nr:TonB-dependent receptor [Bacteroidota bacterium]
MLLTFLFSLLLPLSGNDDSLTVIRLDEVVVTGTRTALSLMQQPAPVHVVDSIGLAAMNGTSVADKLRMLSGVSVRSYGAAGALQSVSVRGMGADYSLVLLDGVRYTTFQIGTVDLGIFSSHDVARIEIANGGNSALYGADAVGGVINIITHRTGAAPFLSASVTGGSYGLSGLSVTGQTTVEGWSLRLSASRNRATNDYEFTYDDGIVTHYLRRAGADFSSKNGSIVVSRSFSEDAVSTLSLRFSNAERGQPSAVTSAQPTASARIHDKDLVMQSHTILTVSPGVELSVPVGVRLYRQTYRDPSIVSQGRPLDAFYDNRSVTVGPLLRYTITPEHSVIAGMEGVHATIASNELHQAARDQYSLFLSGTHRLPMPGNVLLFPSLRYDSFSDTEGGLSAKVGTNIGLTEDPSLHLRASIGRNYRVPTFNDLYWIDGGNPHLTPEHSWNADGGIIAGFDAGDIAGDADAGYFHIDATNKIVWRPGQSGRWSPVNVLAVRSTGLEFRSSLRFYRDVLRLEYHHTVMRTVKTSAEFPNDPTVNKLLPYVPQETVTLSAGTTVAGLSATVFYAVTGYRYGTADNDPRYVLPTVRTVDMNMSYRFTAADAMVNLRAEVNNLLETRYQWITGYPMPLRTFALSLELSHTP